MKEDLDATTLEIQTAMDGLKAFKDDVKHWKEVLEGLKELRTIDLEINRCNVKAAWWDVIKSMEEVLFHFFFLYFF